jgi:hypothetical protein
MFHQLRDGIVRLDPDLTERLASVLMPRFAKAATELANDYAKQLRLITVARKLVREAPKPIVERRKAWEPRWPPKMYHLWPVENVPGVGGHLKVYHPLR